MTKRRVRRKPTTVPEEPVPVEEVLDEEVEVEEPEPEATKPKPKPRRTRTKATSAGTTKPPARKRRVAKPKVVEPPEDDEPEEKPARRARTTRKAAKPKAKPKVVEPEPEDDEDYEEEPEVIKATESDLMTAIAALLAKGITLAIRQVGAYYFVADATTITNTAVADASGKRKRQRTKSEVEAIALSEDYVEFHTWWDEMSYEERVEYAAEEEIVWVEDESGTLVNNLRITLAVMKALEITKWKPEYKSTASRNVLAYGS